MTRTCAGFLGGCLALVGALSARQAHADSGASGAAEPALLLYQAPDGCPSRAQFVAAVAGRGGNFELKGAISELGFEVKVEQRADGFHASLAVHNGAATSNPREVSAPSCLEVVDALAVVTAIALNPGGVAPAAPAVVPVAAPAAPQPSAPPEPPRAPLSGANIGWKETIEVPAGKLHLDNAIQINALFGATLGIAPGRVLPRLDVTFSRANFVTAPNGQSYLTGTVARLRASLLLDTTWRFQDIRAQVGGQEVGVGLCFSPHYDTAGWVVLGCGELSAGLIGVTQRFPFEDTVVSDSTQGFGAVGINLEASYALGAHFQIGGRIGAQAYTSRISTDHVSDLNAASGTPKNELFHSSAIISTAVLGVGTHF